MSDQFDAEFQKMLEAEGEAVPAVAAGKAGKSAKAPKAPKERKPRVPREPDGPNAYGIHNKRGEIITTTYLRKYAQCSSRGLLFNREENINFFMSDEFLKDFVGKSTGEYSQAVAHSDRWNEPGKEPVVKPYVPRVPKEKKAKKVKAQPVTTDDAAEEGILSDMPAY